MSSLTLDLLTLHKCPRLAENDLIFLKVLRSLKYFWLVSLCDSIAVESIVLLPVYMRWKGTEQLTEECPRAEQHSENTQYNSLNFSHNFWHINQTAKRKLNESSCCFDILLHLQKDGFLESVRLIWVQLSKYMHYMYMQLCYLSVLVQFSDPHFNMF